MSDKVFKKIEITGTSDEGLEEDRPNTIRRYKDLRRGGRNDRQTGRRQGRGAGHEQKPSPPYLSVTQGSGCRGPRRFRRRAGLKEVLAQ